MDLNEMQKRLVAYVTHELPEEKNKELMKIGHIAERAIKKQMTDDDVVDTGRLRASINTEQQDENSVLVGTNVEYGQAVNNGHIQHKRFLPAKYLDTPSGRKYLGDGNTKGIMLHETFVQGRHFMEKGMQQAQSQIDDELQKWIDEMSTKLGGE